ncbi:MAG: ribosome maturation factor RimM [Clostridiales bacterium]|jgi:16S rRNA processing protein RimM|nr:ribosome maturation factor RimM [Clostridiales bacterium]
MDEAFFEIGTVVKAQGIKGEVRVFPSTDDPERFSLLGEVFLSASGNGVKAYGVQSSRIHNNMVILKLSGIDDRSAAEKLTGSVIKIPPEKALPLEEGEYYIRDLIDMDVFSLEGEKLGVIREVLRTGANDVYAVKPPEGKEFLIPAIKSCVISVSVEERRMTVDLPEGLR